VCLLVCVSLFYVIDTGSIGSRARYEMGVTYLVEQKNRAGLRKNKVEGCRGATAASSLRTPRDLFSSAWQARANELIAKGDGYTEKRRRHRDLCYCGNE